ncbi:MAG TPA: SRPBCC family protein [Solirubrobacterales bacterium]
MRIEQTFTVNRPPEDVFAYMTDPANLKAWQPSKVSVEPLTEGPPRQGYRVKERTKVGLRQWDQVVEFTEFEPGRVFSTHIVEGSVPVDGRWTFEPDGPSGTRVHFVAEGEITGPTKLIEPLLRRGVAKSFRQYHALLAEQVEAGGGS